ncbi:DUF4129 domain-containing protein [Actinotalea sp. K2]|uniref:DUF4129 domain-containing protein n=1 Tax=Actinotalea sp. K2 TaxID=2939438 RepID=UPI002017B486|nr:DUF4129 domain-containing protein [Actinotalea sp. K2]MCL3862673.1 DUF4129 domain-containing protein [Actinotalea sp. K2]
MARGGVPSWLSTDVPVVPDAETARRWAEAELANPAYDDRPSLLDLLLEWVMARIADAEAAAGALDAGLAAIVVLVVAGVVVTVALLVAGPVRRARRARSGSAEVFGDDTRSAQELRSSADELAAQGRWGEAVLDRFRAVLRSLEDRALLDLRPGRTAHEGAEQAAERLPSCGTDLRAAAALFDDVCYGDATATEQDDAWLRELDRRVTETRPQAATASGDDAPLLTDAVR